MSNEHPRLAELKRARVLVHAKLSGESRVSALAWLNRPHLLSQKGVDNLIARLESLPDRVKPFKPRKRTR